MADLKIITIRDIKAEKVKMLWRPYLPLGKLIIVQGDPNEGKTTLMLAVTAAVTTGKELPGGSINAPAPVIFQTAEDGLADTIKPRLGQLGADCGKVHTIDDGDCPLSLSDQRIEQAIIETGAKLCVLDPIQCFAGGSNMHSANGMRPLMKSLGDAAKRTGCAIVLIGHLSKKNNRAQYRGLGSIDIYAAARSVLTVGKVDDTVHAIVHNKSNLSPPGASLAYSIDPDKGFYWHGECSVSIDDLLCGKASSPEPVSQFEKARRLLERELAGRSVPAAEIIEIAGEYGISTKTLNRAKSAMGVISTRRNGQWYWELPIEVEYTVCQDGQVNTQDGQDGQVSAMTTLTILHGGKGAV
jgi:hypothetical protein